MKINKLIPLIGIATISGILMPLVSCKDNSSEHDDDDDTPIVLDDAHMETKLGLMVSNIQTFEAGKTYKIKIKIPSPTSQSNDATYSFYHFYFLGLDTYDLIHPSFAYRYLESLDVSDNVSIQIKGDDTEHKNITQWSDEQSPTELGQLYYDYIGKCRIYCGYKSSTDHSADWTEPGTEATFTFKVEETRNGFVGFSPQEAPDGN